MPVRESEALEALERGLYQTKTVKVGNLNEGQFGDGSRTLDTDSNGVVGYWQAGSDSPAADAVSVILGWFRGDPVTPTAGDVGDKFADSQSKLARFQSRLRESASELNDSGEFGLGVHKEPTVALDNAFALQDQDPYDPNVTNVDDMPRPTPADFAPSGQRVGIVHEGEYVNWIANPGSDGSQTFDYDQASSVFKLPILKWDGRGL